MTWFRIDDDFHHHPKVLRAGNAAVGLWTRAGAYSSAYLTEGHIDRNIAAELGTRREITSLVESRLWTETPGGFLMPDFLDYNPSAEQVQAERAAARQRQRRARDAAAARRNGHA